MLRILTGLIALGLMMSCACGTDEAVEDSDGNIRTNGMLLRIPAKEVLVGTIGVCTSSDNLELIAETIAEGVLQYFADDIERTAIVRTAGGRLNLREEPSPDAAVLASIPNSAVLTVTTLRNGWYRTQYLGKAGWVSGEYLQLR